MLRLPTDSAPDAGLPDWVTRERIAHTKAVWQPFYSTPLTDEEAVEILLTVGNLYRFLAEVPDHEQTTYFSPETRHEAA